MDTVDVVVVGAGLAGLAAAVKIRTAGCSVSVLEAQPRVGGRVVSVDVAGQSFELGGRWIGPGQNEIKRVASDYGISTFAPRSQGAFVEVSNGSRAVSSLGRERVGVGGGVSLEEALPIVRELDELSKTVPVAAPWKARDANVLDAMTMADWLRKHSPEPVARALGRVLEGFLPEMHEVSLLHGLFYLHSNGGLAGILGLDGPAHDSELFAGGAHLIAVRLADVLGDAVKLSSPVLSLVAHDDYVEVQCTNGRVRGRYVIVALPPALASRLHYDPPMPAARDYLMQRTLIRGKIAVALAYAQPFWRDEGLSGLARHDLFFAWDASSSDSGGRIGALMNVRASRQLAELPDVERSATIKEALADCFGPKAKTPTAYVEKYWAAEPWSRGCNSFMPTGVWTAYGHAWRSPVGRVHWASAEISPEYVGQMEGAIRSGQETAAELLRHLS